MHVISESNYSIDPVSDVILDADLLAVIDALPICINLLTLDGRVIYANRAARETFPLNDGEASGKGEPLVDLFPWCNAPAASAELISSIARAAEGETIRFEAELPIGKERPAVFAVNVAPSVDMTGAIRQLIVSLESVGVGKSAAEASPDSDSRLNFIYNNVADCIFLLAVEPDDCYRFLSINDPFMPITGLRREQVIGKRIEEVLPESSHALVIGKYREAIRENKIVRWEEVAVFPAGVRIGEVSVTPVLDESGICIQLLGVVHDVTASREAEAALKIREERLRLALESSRMGVWDWNVVDNTVEWAANLEAMFGLEPESFSGSFDSFLALVHVDDREMFEAAVRRALEHGADYKLDYRAVLPNGEVRWMHTEGHIISDEDGRPVRMLGINIDITEQKLADLQRQEAQQMLDSALRTSREGFVLLRLRDEMFLDVNDGWLSLTGFERDEIVGKTTTEKNLWVNPEDRERFGRLMHERGSVKDFEFTYLNKASALRKASFSAEVVNAGGEPCALIIGRDITEQTLEREALRESEARLQRLVESNIIGVIFSDFQGNVTMANDAYLQLTGYSREDLSLGKIRWTEMTPAEYRARDERAIAEIKSTSRCTPYEKEYIRKDGGRVPILIGIARLNEGKDACVAFILDLTDRKHGESLLEAQRQVLELIATGAPLPQVLELIVRAIEAHANEALGSILLLDENGLTLRHGAAPSLPPLYTSAIDGISIGPNVGSCGTAAFLRERVIVSDLATDPRWADHRDLAMKHGLRACWSTPILSTGSQVLGTFAIYYREPRHPSPAELKVTELATHLAGIAIERKHAEVALAKSVNRLRTIIETEPECVKVIGRDHLLWEMNPAGLKMIEADSFEQVRGRSVLSRVAPENRAAFQALVDMVLEGQTGTLEYGIVGFKGKHSWAETHAVPLRDHEGEIIGVLGVTRDITDRKLAEDQLKSLGEKLRNLTERLQRVREEESTRIARELHDELGQALTGIVIDLSWLEEKLFDDEDRGARTALIGRVRSATKRANSTVDTVRRIATRLRPALLDDFGVAAAIEWLAQEFEQQTGIHCEVKTQIAPRELPEGIATAVFRIFQEALTNIARHARAANVSITLQEVDGHLCLDVKDDGRGANVTELTGAHSLGVLGMRERALLLGGEVRISGSPGAGTTVSVSIPFPGNSTEDSSAGE